MRSSYFCTFVAVCLQLFNACALPEGVVSGWRPVKPKEFPYLVMLEFKGIKIPIIDPTGTVSFPMMISGSIISGTTVLSINTGEQERADIVAYAGLLSSEEIEKKDTVQKRHVTSMVEPNDTKHDICPMIYRVDKSWEWSEFVASVSLHLSESSLEPSSVMNCQVMGFSSGTSHAVAKMMDKKIGTALQCGLENEAGYLYSKDVIEKSVLFYVGGPAMCNGHQRGINARIKFAENGGGTDDTDQESKFRQEMYCSIYIDIAYFRDWIRENSADCLHRCLKHISIYKVLLYPPLWLLLFMTV